MSLEKHNHSPKNFDDTDALKPSAKHDYDHQVKHEHMQDAEHDQGNDIAKAQAKLVRQSQAQAQAKNEQGLQVQGDQSASNKVEPYGQDRVPEQGLLEVYGNSKVEAKGVDKVEEQDKVEAQKLVENKQEQSLIREIFSKRMGICLVTGFASGMPLFVLINLLSAYLRKEGLDLKVIGAFSLMMIPYTWKFLWAPFIDRYEVFKLGRRKGWIIVSQIALIASIASLGYVNPQESIILVAILATVVAFSSATQDIVLDAYRREFLPDNKLGLGNAVFVNAYRVAGLIPGGVSLIMADYFSWQVVFTFTAACLGPCLLLSFFLKEQNCSHAPRTLKAAIVEPFSEFINRRGVKAALFIVCFVFLYKIGDSMALALATPFYMDLGYNLTTIGIVAKNVGLWSTVVGGLLGGVMMLKIGINRALWVFGFIQLATILGFVLLARLGEHGTPSLWVLALVLVGEYGGGGLGTAAFVAFLAKETNPAYTATQLALLTSFSAIPRTFCNAVTGYLVDGLGWQNFFILCTLLAIPGMLLLFKVAPFNQKL